MSITPHGSDPQSQLLALLHEQGGRLTPARRAVLNVLIDAGQAHLSADEIAQRVAERDPAVHRASVHRALDLFVTLGLVQHVHPGHGAARYHLPGHDGPHMHLQCGKCGQLYDLPPDLLDEVGDRLTQLGFRLAPGHVALSGTCPACLQGSGS